jgi:arsenate reductase-like glutaredoxin family protein
LLSFILIISNKKAAKKMNIQIFGKNKCQDTKKAVRYFKERGIKFQNIDVAKFGMSKGEYQSVKSALGGFEILINTKSKDYMDKHIEYLSDDNDKENALFENPVMFKTPIVRNGKQSTIGYVPDIWKSWE